MQTNNKLREALEVIVRSAIAADEELCSEYGAYTDPWGYIADMKDTARLALAEPVKNCEVGTAEEQAKRWYWRYHEGHLCQSCPLGPRKWSEIDKGTLCFSEWLQMPYEEGGAK